ncbi:MAG TPA: serine/threonine-protein kinase, partial [Minicystis sp.]|nr:serine/threonine-protein kinase [Minicystis sp.]
MNDAPKPATRDPDAAASAADPTLAATSGAAAPVSAASDPAVAAAGCASVGGTYVVAGRYEILGMLGVGGMGTVYRARDRELDEVVALKALRRELVDAPGMLERFRREVKLARRVTHPNVARVFDIGEHDGEKFLTMEYVDGESLAGLLAREGALSVARGVELAVAVCAGLGAAHHAGVVHRDLKPDNVLLSKSGRVVVTDFGIARAVMDGGAGQTAGGLVGTPAYMAPEQVEGAADVDARADVYALGAMLFELFTGARPWIGDAPIAVAAARLVHPPPDPRAKKPDLPTPLARAILRCMARRREERFASVAEVAAELASLTLPAPSAPLSSLPRSSLGPP